MSEKKCYLPLVTIITPVFNGGCSLQETIDSIKNQNYSNIEYIVIDGGSNDSTIDIIKNNIDFITYWVSEKDNGMYEALSKGLRYASGDIIGYLNAGDLYFHNAIKAVVDIFADHSVKWLTGARTTCNYQSVITSCDIPFRYKQSLIRKGYYGRYLPFIQQESTFWHQSLISSVNLEQLSKLKLAGDYFLWYELARENRLFVVESQLGIFKKHPGQLSESIDQYYDEVDSFCEKRKLLDMFYAACEALAWGVHPKLRRKLNRAAYVYDHENQEWRLT